MFRFNRKLKVLSVLSLQLLWENIPARGNSDTHMQNYHEQHMAAAGIEDWEVTVDVNKNGEHEGDMSDHAATNEEKSKHELPNRKQFLRQTTSTRTC